MIQPDFRIRLSAEAAREAAASFAAQGHVRLRNVFSDSSARALHRHLDGELQWSRVLNRGDKVWDLGPESIAAMVDGKDAPLIASVSDDSAERGSRSLMIDRLVDALNGEENLALLRDVVGEPEVARVDGQATRYLPGHFLTSHDDAVSGKGRVAAYVLSLTPQWRTEWGGLLLFHNKDGDIARGLRPCFNAIHLFKVPQLHSVSQVTAFAGAPRLSVTGWLRRW
jgi:SM-20-related protein